MELNLQVWKELATDCALLVDRPDEPGADPPYYINRIEELLRRTDLFVSILTHRRPPESVSANSATGLRCSPYSLFEIRLAERADIPRLILYEQGTRFRPPETTRPWEAYIEFFCGTKERRIEAQRWTTFVQAKIQDWKAWASNHRRPVSYERSRNAVILVSATLYDGAGTGIQQSLWDSGYKPVRCNPSEQSSGEVFRLLHEAGLVLTEFGTPDSRLEQVYAAVHGLGLPTIRMLSAASGPTDLPWILKGDPGGFENDIVMWNKPGDVLALVDPRIAAMGRISEALSDGDGLDYLQSKRYAKFFVFISHTLKGPDRALVEQIYTLLRAKHVIPFEYHKVNTAGIDWRAALDESLKKTTHFVAMLDPTYEQSETCEYELREILKRGNDVAILPFMIAGRDRPNPDLKNMHNELLSNQNPAANAEIVVQQVMQALDTTLGKSRQM
ncbi:MAG: toll/interleukin-1 receptor domain-containing protein [Nitrospira sp.]|nr:toll/interleukin-1 receptor domain-containing protein [Nitrospira sp.]